MKLKNIIGKILRSIPAYFLLICGVAGIYASVTKMADIGIASGITLICLFLLWILGNYLGGNKNEHLHNDG